MSEPKLISPMLDGFVMGDPISEHNGVRCCPAMERVSNERYIVKIISAPASQVQLDALLLSGAYPDKNAALDYFKSVAHGIVDEIEVLNKLSQLEGFETFEKHQLVAMDDGNGYDVYLLGAYRNTLEQHFRYKSMTHLNAVNLGLDLCAALSVCRHSGFLYIDLQPGNIYISDKGYRIGDLGFIKLDALKYASLPDRYRSQYTAPEIEDALSALNTTIDIYAVGLILYQAFNGGILPSIPEGADQFPAPAYADYEMSEIILKACAHDPSDRWQNPIEMGQALVSYMQRNGAHDTPLTPVSESAPEEEAPEEKVGTFEAQPEVSGEELNDAENTAEENIQENVPEEPEVPVVTEESIFTEDESGNLTYIADPIEEQETDIEEDAAEIQYEEVSSEVSDMLQQADDLIAHQAPDPVVQPDPIDVPMPEPIVAQEEELPTPEAENDTEPEQENTTDPDEAQVEGSPELTDGDETEEDTKEQQDDNKKQNRGALVLRCALITLAILALATAGFLYYKVFYLQPIESITLDQSDPDTLTVLVTSKISEDKLSVVCSDTYGNKTERPVIDGKAVFEDLAPNSAFSLKVEIDGFHRLTGSTSTAFTTPDQTNIAHFSAITGADESSVILGFTVDGTDSSMWRVTYNADDALEKQELFAGHTVTLTGFTVGNEYTFRLEPTDDLNISGITEVTYIARKLVRPENLAITSRTDTEIAVKWSAPTDADVESWVVRCYNEDGYNFSDVVNGCTATFTIPDKNVGYTVEVTASGMSVGERVYAAEGARGLTMELTERESFGYHLAWSAANGLSPEGGWIVQYNVEDVYTKEWTCENTEFDLISIIPGAAATVTIKAADGTPLFSNTVQIPQSDVSDFDNYSVTNHQLQFMMCRTPSYSGWDHYDVPNSHYVTEYEIGESASYVIKMLSSYEDSEDMIDITFLVTDNSDQVVSISTTSETWNELWHNRYCEIDIPEMPQTTGTYNIKIYFNGAFAFENEFYVVAY